MLLISLLTAVTLADSTPSQKTLARLLAEHERRTQSEAGNLLGGGALRLPDLSAAKVQRDATRARAVVNELDLLKPTELSADEWLTSRILRFDLLTPIENARYDGISFAFITPYQSPLSSLASTFARLPLATEADTHRYLGMVDSLPMLADTVRAKLESRRASKVLLPKDEIRLIVPFLRAFAPPAAQSPFLPSAARMDALPPDTRTAFTTALTTRLDGAVRTAFDRLATWLEGPYLAEAPTTVGLSQYPDGAAFYRALVRRATTMDVTAEQVHAIGLAEVARIDSAMTAIRAELGFQGTKAEFHAQLARDPKFFAKVPEEFGEKLMYHDARIRPRIG